MHKAMLAAAAALMVTVAVPAFSQDKDNHELPGPCKALIAGARECIPKDIDPDTKTRINHALDLMADNLRQAEPSDRMQLCKTTILTYRQMAGLICPDR